MKFLVCTDSFKGSLTAPEMCDAIREGIMMNMPDAEVVMMPLADGGEGTAEAVMSAMRGIIVCEKVCDPFGYDADGYVGFGDGLCVIDTAAASGIGLTKKYDSFGHGGIMEASTFGTGIQIRRALRAGYRRIIVGLGGSGTNDGGIGAAYALGMKFFDRDGAELDARRGGGILGEIAEVSFDELMPELKEAELSLMFDVAIPLTGDKGCAKNYAPQKGASPDEVDALEQGMISYAAVVDRALGTSLSLCGGTGAAGGLAFSLAACGGKLTPGAEYILDVCGFDEAAADADVIITGEGKCDFQTASGKLPACVAKRAKAVSKAAVVCVCGMSDPAAEFYEMGCDAVFALADAPMTFEESMDGCERLAQKLAYNIAGLARGMRKG